jgi:hypothetical protein
VLAKGTPFEASLKCRFFVLEGVGALYEVLIGQPQLRPHGAYQDPINNELRYRPFRRYRGDSLHVHGLPLKAFSRKGHGPVAQGSSDCVPTGGMCINTYPPSLLSCIAMLRGILCCLLTLLSHLVFFVPLCVTRYMTASVALPTPAAPTPRKPSVTPQVSLGCWWVLGASGCGGAVLGCLVVLGRCGAVALSIWGVAGWGWHEYGAPTPREPEVTLQVVLLGRCWGVAGVLPAECWCPHTQRPKLTLQVAPSQAWRREWLQIK